MDKIKLTMPPETEEDKRIRKQKQDYLFNYVLQMCAVKKRRFLRRKNKEN